MILSERAGPSSQPGENASSPGDDGDVFADEDQPSWAGRLSQRARVFAAEFAEGWKKFRKFMWNKDKGEVMGRNETSWAKILLFYLVFYACLTGFWFALFGIFYQTVSLDRPTYNSLIDPPGVSLVPFPNKQRRIEYGMEDGDEDRTRFETEIKKNVFDVLSRDQSDYENCSDTANTPIGDPPKQRFCQYELSQLGPCANNSGYDTTTPCLYLALNKVWGWVPEGYNASQLKSLFNKSEEFTNRVFFTCDTNPDDQKYVDSLQIYPKQGISFGHYPYVTGTDLSQQARYIRPVVALQADINTLDVDVRIECRARAANIPDEAPGGFFNSRESPSRVRIRIMIRSE